MQHLIEECDRCFQEVDHFAGEAKIHVGGSTFGTNLKFDLCTECLGELRTFMSTRP